ncbi:MAG: head-tail connector protein [Sphingosinicella sp.]|uniref:head-tail connector protein n=1 Tax=Sphingosinicella sp. TaxID=1917971 RepID=UPI004037FC20
MGLKLITAPALEPVSLAEARAHCRVDLPDDDGLLAGYILAARQWAETYLRRALVTQTFELTLEGFSPEIVLPRPPHQSVTSIQYLDGAGTLQTLAASEYQVDLSSGSLAARIRPAYLKTWPTTRLDSYDAVRVRYVAGYGANPWNGPDAIRSAILLLLGHLYRFRETVTAGSTPAELPFGARTLLDPYRDPDSAF